jgi:hypothetical protein
LDAVVAAKIKGRSEGAAFFVCVKSPLSSWSAKSSIFSAMPCGLGDNMLDFQWERHFWEAKAQLPSCVGYQARNGPYGSISSDEPSDGKVTITFAPEGRDESPLTE